MTGAVISRLEPDYIAVSRAFLNFVAAPPSDTAYRLTWLSALLDCLAAAYGRTEACEGTSEQVVRVASGMPREILAARFPELGQYLGYPPCDSTHLAEAVLGVEDALDDLSDIAADLTEAVWLYDNAIEVDARSHFRFGFRSHWGRHLRNLASRLHYLRFEADGAIETWIND